MQRTGTTRYQSSCLKTTIDATILHLQEHYHAKETYRCAQSLLEAAVATTSLPLLLHLMETQPSDVKSLCSDESVFGPHALTLNSLVAACIEGDLEAIDSLLSKGAELNRPSPFFGSALNAAIRSGQGHVVQHLFDRGADIQACTLGTKDLIRNFCVIRTFAALHCC